MQKNHLQMLLMLKRLSLFVIVFNLLGLLCSPLVFAQDELEDQLEKAKADSEKLVDEVSKLQDQFGKDQNEKNPPVDAKQMQQSLDLLLSHYSPMTEKQISDEVIQNVNSNTIKNILIKYPKIGIFVARLLKDKNALKKLFELMTMTEELKKAGLWFLGTFVAGFLLNKILFRPRQSFLSKLRSLFIRFIILNGARIGIVVYFYGANLGPAFKIAKSVFLNS